LQDNYLRAIATLESSQTLATVYVAFSGGMDSTVLLDVAAWCHRERLAHLPLKAIHVNHQLQSEAGQWVEQCRQTCERSGIDLVEGGVEVSSQSGIGLEAAAREARYRFFESRLVSGDVLMLGHHAEDQIETFFLHLMRGSGSRGLAAIPFARPCGAGRLARPFLTIERDRLLQYAQLSQLSWIEDPSNQNIEYDRNFLRHQVIPCLKSRWPHVVSAVGRSARILSAESALLAEMGESDFQACSVKGGCSVPDGCLPDALYVDRLAALSEERRTNLLRYWLSRQAIAFPGTGKMEQATRVLIFAGADASPVVELGEYRWVRYGGVIYLQNTPNSLLEEQPHIYEKYFINIGQSIDIKGVGRVSLVCQKTAGIDKARLKGKTLEIRFRLGGETIRLGSRGHTRKVKELMREANIAPWERSKLPMLYADNELIALWDGRVASHWYRENTAKVVNFVFER
jgi:tRNA(Ile)-lysidine synthase